jgi:putative tryptophan/tyrosine transport system substrate-binding protein
MQMLEVFGLWAAIHRDPGAPTTTVRAHVRFLSNGTYSDSVNSQTMRANNAIDSDTVRSALRAPHGARHRGRSVAQLTARSALLLVAGILLAAAPQAVAQPATQPVRSVGLLVPNRLQVQNDYPVFVDALRQLGYREGENLRFLPKEAAGRFERLPSLARELVDARVEVIVAFNTPGVRAAIDATREIPIVMINVGSGFVTNLAKPGGNVTGVSNRIAELASKRMQILREAIPSARRIAVLFNPGDPVTKPQIVDLENSAKTVDFRLFPVRKPDELPDAFNQILAWKAHAAMWLIGQQQLFQAMTVRLAAQHKLPVMVANAGDVLAGGLISYANSFPEVYRRTAAQVDLILKGKRPGDLPVEQPTKFELAVNVKTAKALGLKIPDALLLRADHVVE